MQQYNLKNGMRVLLAPVKGTDTVTVVVLVRVGSRYEYQKLNGATHFIEHLLFKGTKRRPTAQHISRTLDAIGADYNAYTEKHVTGYHTKVDRDSLPLALDILSDMIFESKFDQAEVKRERNVVIEEINMYRDNPMHHVEDLIEEALFDGSTLGWNIAGTAATMMKMPRVEIVSYYQEHYQPSNMVLVIAGNIDSCVRMEIQKRFGQRIDQGSKRIDFAPFVASTNTEAPFVRLQTKDTEQIQLAIAFPSYGVDDSRNFALNLLSIILGGNMSSRLFVQVRERRGLAYFVRASNHLYDDVGAFLIRAGLDKKRLPLAMKTIVNQLRSVVKNGVAAQELKNAKTFLRGQISIQLEDSAARAEWLARQFMFQKEVLDARTYLKHVTRVSRADMKRVAKEVIDFSRMSLAAVGPYKDRDEFLEVAGIG